MLSMTREDFKYLSELFNTEPAVIKVCPDFLPYLMITIDRNTDKNGNIDTLKSFEVIFQNQLLYKSDKDFKATGVMDVVNAPLIDMPLYLNDTSHQAAKKMIATMRLRAGK